MSGQTAGILAFLAVCGLATLGCHVLIRSFWRASGWAAVGGAVGYQVLAWVRHGGFERHWEFALATSAGYALAIALVGGALVRWVRRGA